MNTKKIYLTDHIKIKGAARLHNPKQTKPVVTDTPVTNSISSNKSVFSFSIQKPKTNTKKELVIDKLISVVISPASIKVGESIPTKSVTMQVKYTNNTIATVNPTLILGDTLNVGKTLFEAYYNEFGPLTFVVNVIK